MKSKRAENQRINIRKVRRPVWHEMLVKEISKKKKKKDLILIRIQKIS